MTRILKFPSGDFNPDDDKELEAALNVRETETSEFHPLEVFLDRQFLINEIEEAVQAIHKNYDWSQANSTQRNYIQAIIQQRVEFLEDLRTMVEPKVYVSLYFSKHGGYVMAVKDDDDMIDADDVFDFTKDFEDGAPEGYGEFGKHEDDLPL